MPNEAMQVRMWERFATEIMGNKSLAQRIGSVAAELEAAEEARYLALVDAVLQVAPQSDHLAVAAESLRRQMEADGWRAPVDPTRSLLPVEKLEMIAEGRVAGVVYVLSSGEFYGNWVEQASRDWMANCLRNFADSLYVPCTAAPVDPVAEVQPHTAEMDRAQLAALVADRVEQ